MSQNYDSILVASFGGPNGPEDVLPFLENVTRGRNIPRERLEEVAEHYLHFGGKSPINEQNLALIDALKLELKAQGLDFPVYFGNRNWHPFFEDALREMQAQGKTRALAFFTSMFSCYSGCRQYRENIISAQDKIGQGAPQIHKLRMGFNHPGFIAAMVERIHDALLKLPEERREDARLVFTAHSIPVTMAKNSDYQMQLQESAKLISEQLGYSSFDLCFQSRSGPPQIPWLEPDICDLIRELAHRKIAGDVVVIPLGFVSDHMEVLFDLDTEARQLAEELGIGFVRAESVGTHPKFVKMIVDLIKERIHESSERKALGSLGAWHDVCPVDCCKYEPLRPVHSSAA